LAQTHSHCTKSQLKGINARMFTGIITDLGEVLECSGVQERQFKILCDYKVDTIDLGASISCNGCCLTVTAKGLEKDKSWFEVTVSNESITKTTLGAWQTGDKINLERALKHGDELGGHLVSGHVDGTATIVDKEQVEESIKYTFRAPQSLMRYIAPKGSIALNGTSLTVNNVENDIFDIMMIPHTLAHTTWGMDHLTIPGSVVNIEIDMLARYAEKLAADMKS